MVSDIKIIGNLPEVNRWLENVKGAVPVKKNLGFTDIHRVTCSERQISKKGYPLARSIHSTNIHWISVYALLVWGFRNLAMGQTDESPCPLEAYTSNWGEESGWLLIYYVKYVGKLDSVSPKGKRSGNGRSSCQGWWICRFWRWPGDALWKGTIHHCEETAMKENARG